MDAVLRALADETRRRILTIVWRRERTAGEIAENFDMSRPSVSQHLGVLLESNLISVRRDGTRRLYITNRKTLTKLRLALASFWEDRLDDLKSAAEAAERKRKHQ